jgi:hypothetical protein
MFTKSAISDPGLQKIKQPLKLNSIFMSCVLEKQMASSQASFMSAPGVKLTLIYILPIFYLLLIYMLIKRTGEPTKTLPHEKFSENFIERSKFAM